MAKAKKPMNKPAYKGEGKKHERSESKAEERREHRTGKEKKGY